MDEPALLVPEWERKDATDALMRYYDEVWVYGLKDVYQPLAALDLPGHVRPVSPTRAICAARCRRPRR